MKKRQRKVRLIRAAIQLVFFIFYPALFSTAFAGVKSVFQAIAAHQQIAWNSLLDVTGLLLLVTIFYGRHFCGYASAFGSLAHPPSKIIHNTTIETKLIFFINAFLNTTAKIS